MPQHLAVWRPIGAQNLRTTARLVKVVQHTRLGGHIETVVVLDTGMRRFSGSSARTPIGQCVEGALIAGHSGSGQISELRVGRVRNGSAKRDVQHWIAEVVREHREELAVVVATPSGQHSHLKKIAFRTS